MRASAGESAMFVGGQRTCWRPKNSALVSIALNCAMRSSGPITCTQPRFAPGSTRLISVNESSPFCSSHNAPDTGSNAKPNEFRIP